MLIKQLAQKNALLVTMESTMTAKASTTTTSMSTNGIDDDKSQQQKAETAAAILELKARIQGLELQLREGEMKHAQTLENLRIEKEQLTRQYEEKEKTLQMQVTEGNVRLQECEESAWQARAEAGELLHAYESEKRSKEVLQVKLGQVEGTLAALERAERARAKDTETTTGVTKDTTVTASTANTTDSMGLATAAAGMDAVSLDDPIAATVPSSNGLADSTGTDIGENGQNGQKKDGNQEKRDREREQEKEEMLQQVERLQQQVKGLEAALTQSKGEAEQTRLQVSSSPLHTVLPPAHCRAPFHTVS